MSYPNYRYQVFITIYSYFTNFLDALFLSFGRFLVYKLLDIYKHFIPKQARISYKLQSYHAPVADLGHILLSTYMRGN